MEKFSYTLTLEDCRDYVKFQEKIPRVKKFLTKQFRPFVYICIGFLLLGLIFEIIRVCISLNWVANEYSMTFFEAVKSQFFLPTLGGAFDSFLNFGLPLIIIWFVLYHFARSISKYDLFHAESNKVYSLLKGQDLDITITPQDDGLLCSGKHTKTFYDWQKIIDVYDTCKSFLVYVGDYAALVIPKRAFETPEESAMFFKYLNDKLNQKLLADG